MHRFVSAGFMLKKLFHGSFSRVIVLLKLESAHVRAFRACQLLLSHDVAQAVHFSVDSRSDLHSTHAQMHKFGG